MISLIHLYKGPVSQPEDLMTKTSRVGFMSEDTRMVETTNVFKRGVNRYNQDLIRFEQTQPESTVLT